MFSPSLSLSLSVSLSLSLCLSGISFAQTGASAGADWAHYGGTQFSWRYSSLDQINTQNVKSLAPAWLFQTGDYAENLQATPIVENGVLYLITARTHVYALNAATGSTIWHYAPPDLAPQYQVGFLGSRGLAIGDGKVFFGTRDNYMVALDQKTGSYTAEGNVSTTRQPSRKGGASSSAMLSNEEIMQATARKMTSTDDNQKIHYEGDAKAWQGANRVSADRLDIDQSTHIMQAHGKVETQFFDKNTKTGPAISTTVRAADLEYSSDTRIAHYTGGVHLERPALVVDSKELRAYLKNTDADSSLDKALADGAVKLVSTTMEKGKGKRIRTGTSEHAEYFVDEQRVVLNGGQPLLVDSEKGRTTGCELTWWANNDWLLVGGGQNCPVQTVIPKK